MRSIINGMGKMVCLGVLTVLFVGCGGGGSSGGFTRVDPIRISMTSNETLLPVNSFGSPPGIGGPFTNTFTVRVEKPNGQLFPAPQVSIDLNAPEGNGALFRLDGEDEEDDNGNLIASRRLVYEDTTGVVTGHFHAGPVPGTVTLVASAADPNSGETVSATLELTVGTGASSGQPAFIGFSVPPNPLYITGQGQVDIKVFGIQVLDDGGLAVPNPGANNLRLELLPGRPNGGEELVAVDASGNTQRGITVNTRTINGVAEATLQAGTLPGTVRIAAIVDRDNNVDNGLQEAVTDVTTIPIGSGEIVSLSFTGPFPGAVQARANTLGIEGLFDNLVNGVYSRLITLMAVDQFGNPAPPGQPITLRLIDSPLSGYPNEGRGTFDIGGDDGNPEEGGFTFTTETSSLAGTQPNCLLFFGGISPEFIGSQAESRREFRPNQEGSRIVTGVTGNNLLSVNTVFNETPDTGFDVPYIVGCVPHFGNVANNPGGVNLQTDVNGIASTVMNYPITQLGRHFCLAAEANGGQVGALLCHWYLGVADGSTLQLIPPEDADLIVSPGETVNKTITLQLLDGNDPPSPLPGERIAVKVVITDPDKTDRIAAELAVDIAQARLDAARQALTNFVAANSGINFTNPVDPPGTPQDCLLNVLDDSDPPQPTGATEPNPNAVPECEIFSNLQQDIIDADKALQEAQQNLAEAIARDDAHEPTASVEPENPMTGANGLVTLTLTVSDLPPNGKVEFFISTLGPEVLAETVTVTVSPTQGDDGGGDGGTGG